MKPEKLTEGDTVAIITSAWGGPNEYPKTFEQGLKIIKSFGLNIKEYPTTRCDDDFLHRNPQKRAEDLNQAFMDPEVKGIFSSIGGDDSIWILRYLDVETIKNNPKILMGYSDTTILLSYINQLGLVTFHGPSVMAGFAQLDNFGRALKNTKNVLFNKYTEYEYFPFPNYCHGYPDWGNDNNTGKINDLIDNDGWHWLQGEGTVRGKLYGGCLEVLEFMKATKYWPSLEFWEDKILFFETSEDLPNAYWAKLFFRNYGVQGIFDKIHGIIIGRPRDMDRKQAQELENNFIDVLNVEFDNPDLVVVSNFDFGHTDPQHIIPLGIEAEINVTKQSVKTIEPWYK